MLCKMVVVVLMVVVMTVMEMVYSWLLLTTWLAKR